MIGYKGFDKEFRCRGMQYEVGKTYRHDGELELCVSGFHFCQNPLAMFEYYPPADSRYALVEATGKVVKDENKSCTDELKIVCELTLAELIAAVPDEKKSTNKDYYSASVNTGYRSALVNTGYRSASVNTGDCSVSVNTGDRSASVNTGYCSASVNTGDCSVATNTSNHSASVNTGDRSASVATGYGSTSEVTGENSVALVIGRNSRAKGAIGCWLILADWRGNEIADVQVFKVDGEKILPDTFYTLKNGQLTEVQS